MCKLISFGMAGVIAIAIAMSGSPGIQNVNDAEASSLVGGAICVKAWRKGCSITEDLPPDDQACPVAACWSFMRNDDAPSTQLGSATPVDCNGTTRYCGARWTGTRCSKSPQQKGPSGL